MSNFDEKLIQRLTKLEREVERLRVKEKQVFVPLTTPLTSTSWDGDAYSTTSKTLIDLSVVFGVPAGVKAILAQIMARDSGSSSSATAFFGLSPDNVDGSLSLMNTTRYIQNDLIVYNTAIVPCTSTGDVYYQVVASGSGTMDCWIRIWGYWL